MDRNCQPLQFVANLVAGKNTDAGCKNGGFNDGMLRAIESKKRSQVTLVHDAALNRGAFA